MKEKTKNICGKTKDVNEPYEIWKSMDGSWEWRVLKKYQAPHKEKSNEYARWFCAVKSPMTYGRWEYGDTYIADIKSVAIKTK